MEQPEGLRGKMTMREFLRLYIEHRKERVRRAEVVAEVINQYLGDQVIDLDAAWERGHRSLLRLPVAQVLRLFITDYDVIMESVNRSFPDDLQGEMFEDDEDKA